jgi:hypothetical protein
LMPAGRVRTQKWDEGRDVGLARDRIMRVSRNPSLSPTCRMPDPRKPRIRTAKSTRTNDLHPQERWTTPSSSSPSATSSTRARDRPIERCPECGSVYKMEYVGPQDDGHGHGDHAHDIHHDSDGAHNYEGEPVTMADFIKPEYR